MTQISIALAVDAPGGRQGVPGLLTATAQRIRTDDATVIIPGPVDFPIAATGTTVVNLDSPGPDWSWHLVLSRKGGTVPSGFVRIVAPYPNMDTDFGSVDFEDGVAIVADGHPLIAVFRANGYAVDDGTTETLVTERDVVFGLDPITWVGLVDIDPATRLPTAQPAKGLTPLILDAIAKFAAGDSTVQVAAVAAVQAAIVGQQLVPGAVLEDAWGWSFALYYQGTREVAFGIKTDGTVYPPQPVAAKSVTRAGLADDVTAALPPNGSVVSLDDSQSWAFAIYYQGTSEVAFGIRNDGTMYPTPGGSASGTGVSAALTKLDMRVPEPVVIVNCMDSTGNELDEYYVLALKELMAELYPERAVDYIGLAAGDATLAAPVAWQAGTTLANGSLALPKVTIYNAAVPGSRPDYHLSRLATIYPAKPDLLVFGHGHNTYVSPEEFTAVSVPSFTTPFMNLWPGTGVALTTENPRFDPATHVGIMAQRMAAAKAYALRIGWTVWDTYSAMTAATDGGKSLVNDDGIHPKHGAEGNGSRVQADAIKRAWKKASARAI